MIVSEIIERAQAQSEEIYDDPTWIQFINLGIDDLTPVCKVLKSKEDIAVTLTAGMGEVDIAADADLAKSHEILNTYFKPSAGTMEQLRPIPFSNNYSKGWKFIDGKVKLQNCGSVNGTARIDYYKKLDKVTSVGDTPEMPEQYHNLLILYSCAKSQQKEEELNDKNDFYNEYLMGKRNMAIDRIWIMEPYNRKYIKKARIAALIGNSPQ